MWLVKGQFSTTGPAGVIDEEDSGSISAPALEPAYEFQVTVYYSWQPARRRWSSWPTEREERARVCEIIRGAIRQSSRKHSIFDPAEAERAVNARLAEALDKAQRTDRIIRPSWTARAEMGPPDEVLSLMRKTLHEEYRIRAKAETAGLLISKTGELREGWDHFLDDAAMSRNAQHAVRLAENPREIAQVLEEVLKDRRKGAESLLTLINKIVEAQRSADILDLVVKSETVLHQTLKMMGIPLPESVEGTLLEPLEGEV